MVKEKTRRTYPEEHVVRGGDEPGLAHDELGAAHRQVAHLERLDHRLSRRFGWLGCRNRISKRMRTGAPTRDHGTHPRRVVPDEDVARVERREDPWLLCVECRGCGDRNESIASIDPGHRRRHTTPFYLKAIRIASPSSIHPTWRPPRSIPPSDSQSNRSIYALRPPQFPSPCCLHTCVPPRLIAQLTSTGCRSTDLMRSDRAVSFFFTSSRSGWRDVLLDSVKCVYDPGASQGERLSRNYGLASLARTMVAAAPFPSPLPTKTKGRQTTGAKRRG